MDSRKVVTPSLNYEDFDPDYDQIQEPQVDTLLIYLPGFKKEQIRVQLTSAGILKISGQQRLEGDKWKRFLKEFQVSSNCDTNQISAKFDSGTLFITQPKLIIPAALEKPADAEEEKIKEAAEPKGTKKGEESENSESEPTKRENDSDKKGIGEDDASDKKAANGERAVDGKSDGEKSNAGKAAKMENDSDKKGGIGAASRIEPGEQTKLDDDDDDASSYKNDKRAAAVAGKSEGEKSGGAGKAAKIMDGYSGNAVQLKRSRKMMNVALVVLLVVGVGFYLNTKIRSSSSNDAAGEL